VITDSGTYEADVLLIALGADYDLNAPPSLVMPFGIPVPPSPATSKALLTAFAERCITFVPNRLVRALDPERRVAIFDDKSEMSCDLFLGIPKHRVPDVVVASGMTEDGWIPVDPNTLKTRFPGVYAVGDVTSVETPKAGVFAEGAARTVAAEIIADLQGSGEASAYRGIGSCYVEFGEGLVGRMDVEFLAGPPTGSFMAPSAALAGEKQHFGSSRRVRWFGL